MSGDLSRRSGAKADRDHILEQALKHELRASGPTENAHLDAETLAAWAEDALDANALAACEAHVSNCSRCQALVATLARGTAGIPGTSGTPGTLGTLGTPSTPGTFSLWRWWLAPIAAGVTAVTLWMVVPEEQRQLADAAPQKMQSRVEAPDRPAPVPAEQSKAVAESRIEADKLAVSGRADRQQNQAVGERKEEQLGLELRDRAASADAAAAAPAALPPPAAVALEQPPPLAELGALRKSTQSTAGSADIPTADPNRRWRVAGDRIERTVDAGRSWTLIRQEREATLTSGSAPSPLVAWFVGRGGVVLITTDGGETFSRVDLAEPFDLTNVAATDSRIAQIFANNGRRFRTDDGGTTWRPF